MCNHGEFKTIVIKDIEVEIDKCLVPYIETFQNASIETLTCCCGHGK